MANNPKVFIVTLNWNGFEDTSTCLKSLKKIEYDNYKIAVVDNGSENNEAAKLAKAFPKVTIIRHPFNRGFTGGNNSGIELALRQKADYVLLLNNDTIVTPDFLTEMIEFYESQADIGVVSPRITYLDRKTIWFDGAKLITWLGVSRNIHKGSTISTPGLTKKPFRTGYNSGAAFLMSTKLIKQIGKLNPKYFIYFEDLEWCYKAARLGKYSYVVPQALIYHKKSASSGGEGKSRFNKRPAYLIARNAILFSTNLNGLDKFLYLIAQIWFKLPLSLALLVSPKAWPDYLAGLIRGFYMLATGQAE